MTDESPELPSVVASESLGAAGYLTFRRDTIRFANGHQTDRAIVGHPGAVAIIAIDEGGKWLLVSQYRHAARRNLLEIPAGTRDHDEVPEATAAREVREEIGYAAGSLVRLGGTYMVPGWGEEYIDFFLATDLQPSPLPQDDDEYLSEPIRMTLAEVNAAVDDGRIEDAKTVTALTLYQRYLARVATT